MANSDNRIRWATRVKPALIRRLYETDSKRIVDVDLIDEVGYGLLARCESIRRVTERCCPECGERFGGINTQERNRPISCSGCDWESTWGEYHRSYKGDRVHGGRAYETFLRFLEEFPRCRTPQQKMLAIDRLIHAVHEEASKVWTTPAAVNLIQAKSGDVVELLENLAYGDQRCAERKGIRATYLQKRDESLKPTERQVERVRQRHLRRRGIASVEDSGAS